MLSYGSLGLGGVVASALGSVMLINSDSPGFDMPRTLIYTLALASLAFAVGVAMQAARTRRRPVVSGTSTLVGVVGEVMEANGVEGWARFHGEHWRVRGAQPLRLGEHVRIKRVDGSRSSVEGAQP